MNRFELTAVSVVLAAAGTAAAADCPVTEGRLSIVGNEFPAIQSVAQAAIECMGEGAEASSNLTADHQKINVAGMSGDPAEYTTAVVANSSITALTNEDLIRPLDDLIAEYGQDIPDMQKITIDGQVMAIAFMANAQHLVYREDVLEEAGLEVPQTYEEVLAAAEAIREAGLMEYPLSGTYAAGWNLAQEFINMYIGHGGAFFEPGSAQVSINNEAGVASLEMMKSLTAYMNPDYLTFDSNAAQAEWEAGNVALMTMWGSRMGNMTDEEGAAPEVYENTRAAAPVTVGGNERPATTLFWDGWTVAKNISDEDAAATFQAMAHATSPAILNDETQSQAVWLIEGYEPSAANEGVVAATQMGTRPYPTLPYQGLLHTALGNNIADYLQGDESAEQTLQDIEDAYSAAAREKGFLN